MHAEFILLLAGILLLTFINPLNVINLPPPLERFAANTRKPIAATSIFCILDANVIFKLPTPLTQRANSHVTDFLLLVVKEDQRPTSRTEVSIDVHRESVFRQGAHVWECFGPGSGGEREAARAVAAGCAVAEVREKREGGRWRGAGDACGAAETSGLECCPHDLWSGDAVMRCDDIKKLCILTSSQ